MLQDKLKKNVARITGPLDTRSYIPVLQNKAQKALNKPTTETPAMFFDISKASETYSSYKLLISCLDSRKLWLTIKTAAERFKTTDLWKLYSLRNLNVAEYHH